MKYKILMLFLLPLLFSCAGTVDVAPPETVVNVRLYNSAWEIVQEGYVETRVVSRSVTTIQSYDDYVTEYNAEHTDDQLFLIEGEEVVPIEEAPNADAYIVDPTTHDIISEYLNWPRVDLSDRREVWRFQAMAIEYRRHQYQ